MLFASCSYKKCGPFEEDTTRKQEGLGCAAIVVNVPERVCCILGRELNNKPNSRCSSDWPRIAACSINIVEHT